MTDVTPATAVVSIVIGCDLASVRASFCNHVHFFTNTTAAQPWLYEHPADPCCRSATRTSSAAD